MNVTKEQVDDLNAIIRIDMQNEDYEPRVNEVLKDYRKKVNMPGFRPGKVPAGLVKKMYGKAILIDEINKLVSESLSDFIADNELNILGEPLPSEAQKTIDFDEDNHFEFAFDVALAPQMEVNLSKQLTLPFYEITTTDDMIDGHKKNLTSRFGKTEPRDEVTEKTTVKADFVQLDQEGNPLEEGIVANDSVMSMAVMKDEELKKKFIGSKVGDSIVFDPKKAFPNDTELSYLLRIDKEQAEQLGGDFSCTIKEISEYVDPELNQEMYDQIFGPGLVTSEEEFNQKVKEELTRTFAMESEYQFARDAREKLVNKTEMQLPKVFLRRWLKATNKREEQISDEQLEKEMPGFLKDLKWQLIRNEIVKSNELKIENEDVLNFARKAARLQFMQYGLNNVPDEYIDNYATDMLKKEENQRNYAEGAINDKVMAFIKESVKLDTKEVSRDEFNKLYDEN